MTTNPTNEIQRVLSYYHDEVIPALAAAVTIDDKFPIEVLNEVRNAFTHLSRAHCMDGADDVKCKECEGALRHLKRTVLDCLKVCILALAKKSEAIMDALAGEAALPNGTTAKARALRKRRRELSSYEGQNSTDDVIEKLKHLFKDYDDFYAHLANDFDGESAETRRRHKRLAELRTYAVGFLLGIAASVLATMIHGAFFPA